jgi:soluble lytic murein transglycosylase
LLIHNLPHPVKGCACCIFGLVFLLSLSSCTAQESVIDFYEGLKKRQEEAKTEAISHFEKALGNSNIYIAAAAAAELMSLHAAGTEIEAQTIALAQQKLDSEAAWIAGLAAGYRIMALETPDREKTAAENAAASGSIAVSRVRYTEALLFFRIALAESPELFFRHPDLLSDLGRTFQYTATGTEGMDLFLKWEQALGGGENADEQGLAMQKAIPQGSENLVRFRLLFFAARIARQRGSVHIELFERALPLASDAPDEQSDACIWYILDSALSQSPDAAIKYLETYISQWHDDGYFSDVVDKLSRELVLKRQWESILKTFTLLQGHSGAMEAQFAWIIGRAIEGGYLSQNEINRAVIATGGAASPGIRSEAAAILYMRIAYDKAVNTGRAQYYRLLSSAALGEPFLVLPEPSEAKITPGRAESDEMQFLLGFFKNSAAQFAPRWIRLLESSLSPDELRRLAESLAAAGQFQDSIRLVSLYAGRDGYQITLSDLELWYPRPFLELVGRLGKETGIDPALLFALIRTESAFNSNIVSRAGAVGLTQLMPATAEEMAARIRRQGGPDYTGPGLNLRDPAVNIHIGATYLAYLNDRMGDPLLALLAYNGGMNRVRRWSTAAARYAGSAVPLNLPPDLFLETVEFAETRNYGRGVMAAAAIYRELYYK